MKTIGYYVQKRGDYFRVYALHANETVPLDAYWTGENYFDGLDKVIEANAPLRRKKRMWGDWLAELKQRRIARKRAEIDAMSPLLAEQWKPEIP